jgi:fatty acid desaturase
MHPRLIACLVPTIAAAAAGAVWTLMAGWGWLAALLVYSFGGAVALFGFAALALLIDARTTNAPASTSRPVPAMATRPTTGGLV